LRFAEVTLADLPSIALTDYNPMKVPLACGGSDRPGRVYLLHRLVGHPPAHTATLRSPQRVRWGSRPSNLASEIPRLTADQPTAILRSPIVRSASSNLRPQFCLRRAGLACSTSEISQKPCGMREMP